MTTTEHVQMVGPWGWFGYATSVVLALVIYRLWTSDPHVAMRAMKRELTDARKVIVELRGLEMALKNRNAALHTELHELEGKYNSLTTDIGLMRARMKERAATVALQSDLIDKGEQMRQKQSEKIEWLVGRVVQLDAERGMVTKLPWNQ